MHIWRSLRPGWGGSLWWESMMRMATGRCSRLAMIGTALLLQACADPYRPPYEAPPPLAYPEPGPVYSAPPPPAYYGYPAPVPDYYAPPVTVPGPTLYLEERRREEFRREEFRREQERRRSEELREAERRQREQRPAIPVAPPRPQPPAVQAQPQRAAPQPPQSAPRREPERRRNDCDPGRRNRCD